MIKTIIKAYCHDNKLYKVIHFKNNRLFWLEYSREGHHIFCRDLLLLLDYPIMTSHKINYQYRKESDYIIKRTEFGE